MIIDKNDNLLGDGGGGMLDFDMLEDLLDDFNCTECGEGHVTCRCGLEED